MYNLAFASCLWIWVWGTASNFILSNSILLNLAHNSFLLKNFCVYYHSPFLSVTNMNECNFSIFKLSRKKQI
jgi:hypothetical protein